MSHQDIERSVKDLGFWYHNIDLRGIMTNPDMGDYPLMRWRGIKPFLPADLKGKSVLDLGCNSGFFSAMLKKRGAGHVVGVDMPEMIEQAKLVAHVYGVDIDLRSQNVYEFVLTNTERFDVVLFLGLFYHLRYPLLVLDRLAEMTREKLFFQTHLVGRPPATGPNTLVIQDDYPVTWKGKDEPVVETEVFNHPDFPRLFFIEKNYCGDGTNWWFANEPCAWAMLRTAGFRNIVKIDALGAEDCFVCEPPESVPDDYLFRLSRCPTFSPRTAPPLPPAGSAA
jgi:tRNA (mo5U34)-methyltransferase